MCAAPAPTPAATDAATDAAAQPGAAALHSALSDAAAPKIGAGSIAALLSAVERVTCQKGEPARAAEGGDGGDAFLQKVPLPRTEEVHFASSGPGTPGASSSEAQQDKAGGSASAASDDDGDNPATKLNASGFVDNVIPRRRGNEKKVVLTRALLESYHHESLDTVTERLGLSKTTIKAACRKLGLPKWPYQHTGPRKRRMGVMKPEEAGESQHERALKDTFHELMGKRQRFGEVQMAPNFTMGLPLTSLPGSLPGQSMADLQAMHMQSLSALSAMAATLNASGQNNVGLNGTFQGSAFPGQALQRQALQGQALQGQALQGQALQGQALHGQAPVQAPLLFGGNFGGGNYGMPDVFGGFQPWGGPGGFAPATPH